MKECIAKLNQALADPEASRISAKEMSSMLSRALGLDGLLTRFTLGQSHPPGAEEFRAVRDRVHSVLGAPGDWGYHTPLGKALQEFYRYKL